MLTFLALFLLFADNTLDLNGLSRGAAIVLLVEFLCYLWFFYYTHREIDDEELPSFQSAMAVMTGAATTFGTLVPRPESTQAAIPKTEPLAANLTGVVVDHVKGSKHYKALSKLRNEAMHHHPHGLKSRRPWYVDLPILAVAGTCLVFSSLFLLEAVHAPSHHWSLSESFVGLVIMPCVLASVEYVSDALRSRKEGIAWVAEGTLGSSIRVSFFVFPVAVILGWVLDTKMDMMFDGFQVTIVALAIFMVNHVVHNDFAHW